MSINISIICLISLIFGVEYPGDESIGVRNEIENTKKNSGSFSQDGGPGRGGYRAYRTVGGEG